MMLAAPALMLLFLSFLGIFPPPLRPELIQLVEMVDLDNVTFTKSVVFAENGTLAEDVQLLDQMYKEEVEKRPRRTKKRTEGKEEGEGNREEEYRDPEARILMVADHALFEKFLSLYDGDDYSAYTGLANYLLGVFSQLVTIYGRLSFHSSSFPSSSSSPRHIRFQLAGPPMIILRPEDCPLRGPMLAALKERTANNSSSSPIPMDSVDEEVVVPPKGNGTRGNGTNPEGGGDGGLNSALDGGTEGWYRMDGLRSVQWTHRWIERSAALLPDHDHVMVLTRLDLVSLQNDSATQGMAYVRAICRGADSVSLFTVISVVEDVGGLSTATVAAHELSHSLGAFHDGSDVNANCSARQNFLMAPVSASHASNPEFGDTFPNAFVLSPCSKRQIEQFLDSPDSHCLWRHQKRADELGTISAADTPPLLAPNKFLMNNAPGTSWGNWPVGNNNRWEGHDEGERVEGRMVGGEQSQDKPGEQFGPGSQCQIVFGTHYGPCRRRDFLLLNADPCRRLWCKNREHRRWAPCETKGFLPMMDGTHCGEGKWCISGRCSSRAKLIKREMVDDNRRKGTDEWEMRSDQQRRGPGSECRDLNLSFCASFRPDQLRSFCPARSFSRICCASCRAIWWKAKRKKQ